MKLKNIGRTFVNDSPSDKFGLYCWQMPNGAYIQDENGNFLNIPAEIGDQKKISALKRAVENFNIREGHEVFFPGHRQIDDEEYENQRERMRNGLVPDTEDIGSLLDDVRARDGF